MTRMKLYREAAQHMKEARHQLTQGVAKWQRAAYLESRRADRLARKLVYRSLEVGRLRQQVKELRAMLAFVAYPQRVIFPEADFAAWYQANPTIMPLIFSDPGFRREELGTWTAPADGTYDLTVSGDGSVTGVRTDQDDTPDHGAPRADAQPDPATGDGSARS